VLIANGQVPLRSLRLSSFQFILKQDSVMAANYQSLSSASGHLQLDMRHDDHDLTEAAIDMVGLHPPHENHGPHSGPPSEHSGMLSRLHATKC